VQHLPPFFNGKAEFSGKLSVKGRLTGFYHTFHDGMKRFLNYGGFAHGIPPL
jgi:hypothetical protein